MPKKNISYEEQVVDLLQKQLILLFYKEGMTRDDIKKVLSISSDKVSAVTMYLRKIRPNTRDN